MRLVCQAWREIPGLTGAFHLGRSGRSARGPSMASSWRGCPVIRRAFGIGSTVVTGAHAQPAWQVPQSRSKPTTFVDFASLLFTSLSWDGECSCEWWPGWETIVPCSCWQ